MFVSANARRRIREERTRQFARDFVLPLKREAALLGLSDEDIAKFMSKEEL